MILVEDYSIVKTLGQEETADRSPDSERNFAPQNTRNRVSVDLQGSKEAWLSWCRSMRLSPSEGFRGLVARLMPGEWPGKIVGGALDSERPPMEQPLVAYRAKVPLTEQELAAVTALADGEGMTVPRWIVGLVRAYLTDRPQLGSTSIELLRQSNLEVQALSRNLNQIARALNAITEHLDHGRLAQAAEGLQAERGKKFGELLIQVKVTIDRHLPVVSAVLTDNVERWRVQFIRPERRKPQ